MMTVPLARRISSPRGVMGPLAASPMILAYQYQLVLLLIIIIKEREEVP